MTRQTYIFLFIFILLAAGCSDEMMQLTNSEAHVGALTRSGINFEECGTVANYPPSWVTDGISMVSLDYDDVVFNVHIHVIRSSGGVGLDLNTVSSSVISDLNYYYLDTGVSFGLCDSSYIDSDSYNSNLYYGDSISLSTLHKKYNSENCINIYVLSNAESFGAAGLAQSIPSNACIIHNEYYRTSTLPHEVGHCLGLYHTHHGTYSGEKGIPELVDGSNSSHAGDFIVDTPADPNRWGNMVSECVYQISSKDANGDTYAPDPTNIMSYAKKSCRTVFSDGQIERMHSYISRNDTLQKALAMSIDGISHFYANAEYKIKGTGSLVKTIVWSVVKKDANSNVIDRTESTSNTLYLSDNDNGDHMIYDITATATLNNGVVLKATKRVTSGYASPDYGYIYWSCCNVKNGESDNENSKYIIEFETIQEITFEVSSYVDYKFNFTQEAPEIYVEGLDIEAISEGNKATISVRDNIAGEGEFSVYIYYGSGVYSEPFTVRYKAFKVD
jgi:hypothetical protein